jgi:hypothetical protein
MRLQFHREYHKTQYEHGMEKCLKQQIVTKTNSLAKGSALDLEKFNYDDDLISMDEMTAIEDLNINSK